MKFLLMSAFAALLSLSGCNAPEREDEEDAPHGWAAIIEQM